MLGVSLPAFCIHRPSSIYLSRCNWDCLYKPFLQHSAVGASVQYALTLSIENIVLTKYSPGSFYFSLVIAILAAVVASQAMITASFQLLSQVMALSYFPHIKTVHTSKRFHGQLYMPLANWLLMIGTVIVTAVYSNVRNSRRIKPFSIIRPCDQCSQF
jgi:KUP system potassium uptake protein